MNTRLLSLLMLAPLFSSVHAAEARLAVASNFATAIKPLVHRFEQQSSHRITLAFASTGKHYAHIRHGAPFDAFLAADKARPQRLEQQGLTQANSRFTYAIGKLVLWSPDATLIDSKGKILQHFNQPLALANPRLAPYGLAAKQVLQAQGLWQRWQQRLIRGENISQTFQFVRSGNVKLGFVAWSQLQQPGKQPTGSWWLPARSLYQPVAQQAVLLRNNNAARAFLAYLKTPAARQLIQQYGYDVP